MAKKADMLKKGAMKTGRGLFYGMEKLNATEEASESVTEITSDIVKADVLTEQVDEVKAPQGEKKETESEKPAVEEPAIEKKEEPTVYTDDDTLSRRPVENSGAVADTEEKSVVLDEILKDVSSDNKGENTNKAVEKEEMISESTAIQANTAEEKPQAVDNKGLENEVKDEINNSKNSDEKPAKKQNSRYEKDKFLLLDIRGYRDYIEHIAKVANMSATKYIRSLIEQDMEKNKEIYLAQKRLEEMLRGKSGK